MNKIPEFSDRGIIIDHEPTVFSTVIGVLLAILVTILLIIVFPPYFLITLIIKRFESLKKDSEH